MIGIGRFGVWAGSLFNRPHLPTRTSSHLSLKRRGHLNAKIGDVVLYYDCLGCMGESHELRWVGQIVQFQDRPVYNGNTPGPIMASAIVEIMKQGNQDHRGRDLGTDYFILDDTCAQRLGRDLIVIFK